MTVRSHLLSTICRSYAQAINEYVLQNGVTLKQLELASDTYMYACLSVLRKLQPMSHCDQFLVSMTPNLFHKAIGVGCVHLKEQPTRKGS